MGEGGLKVSKMGLVYLVNVLLSWVLYLVVSIHDIFLRYSCGSLC